MNSMGQTIPPVGTAIVFDVAASSGGAMSVLSDFYDEIAFTTGGGAKVYLVHSTGDYSSTDSVHVLKYSWPKRNWLLRLVFDAVVAPYLVRSTRATTVISLQNIMVPFVAVKKILLVHTPLPFVDTRFRLRDEPVLWAYQNLMAPAITHSIRRADTVVVQTQWMKRAVLKRTHVASETVLVVAPPAPRFAAKFVAERESFTTFFYPASSAVYKNHSVVVDAVERLVEQGVLDFKVIFTLTGSESAKIAGLSDRVTRLRLPVEFAGASSREATIHQMARSVLLFPSYIETFGLPLLEARQAGSPILAADKPFSREVLDGYEDARFFDSSSVSSLQARMLELISGEFEYQGGDGGGSTDSNR